MKTIQKELPLAGEPPILNPYPAEGTSLFLDIETTGFSALSGTVYLIGCCSLEEDRILFRQWFAETPAEEAQILEAASAWASRCSRFITYNGETFDLPFLRKRSEQLGLSPAAWERENLDLYKVVRPLRSRLGLPDAKQKTAEAWLGLSREDRYTGGQLIEIYRAYGGSPDPEALRLLLLHNEEDVLAMPRLLPFLTLRDFFAGNTEVTELIAREEEPEFSLQGEITECIAREEEPAGGTQETAGGTQETEPQDPGRTGAALCITLRIRDGLPRPVLFHAQDCRIFVRNDIVRLTVPLFTGVLRRYFPDYRNYWYLPEEDMAIHKSVALFVEKEHRKKATPETACVKKEGVFLRIPEKTPVPLPDCGDVFRGSPGGLPWILRSECPETPVFWTAYLRSLLL